MKSKTVSAAIVLNSGCRTAIPCNLRVFLHDMNQLPKGTSAVVVEVSRRISTQTSTAVNVSGDDAFVLL